MKPPKSIRVGPFDIKTKQLEGEARDSCLGTFSETTLSISMRDVFETDQQEAETYLHELLHAIYNIYGIREKDSQERIVTQMSIGMASVIRDNPDLVGWLKEKLS